MIIGMQISDTECTNIVCLLFMFTVMFAVRLMMQAKEIM